MFQSNLDRWFEVCVRVIAILASTIIGMILLFLFAESSIAVRSLDLRIITDQTWQPAQSARMGSFGLVPMVIGSLAVTTGAVLIAAPVGLASALFLQFYAPRPASILYQRLIELLAGIPSVVFGFWGLVILAPIIGRWHPPGPSLLTGIVVVALMILPTVTLIIHSTLQSVPNSYLEAGVSLGMGRWSIIRRIVIPSARHGIATGIILGAARAVGETMAVVMVCGNIARIPKSLFDPVRALTANIALEMGYALGVHRSALFESGLLLLLICMFLVAVLELTRRLSSSKANPI